MIFPAKSGVACVLGLTLLPLTIVPVAAADELAWPPLTAQTRPWAWWWWHGSAVDETNIAHELQRFHDAGLGGVQITTIYGTKGADARDIPYLTPRWLAMMGSTVDQAHRLGLGVDMSLGSGWCFGGPTVSDRDANASVVVKTYTVAAGGTVFGKFNRDSTQALVAFAPDGQAIELTDKISTNGEVNWMAPANVGQASRLPGERDSASGQTATNAAAAARAGGVPGLPFWTIYAISQKPSGQKVKRPAIGGEGWMLNPAYAQSVRDWLPWFDQALANYTGSKPEAVFQDSYEYRTDWAPDFFAQFEELRGYKLQTELPALFAEDSRITDHASRATDPDHIARVKYDYRRTISDIMANQSEPAWIDWAHKHGFSTIYQAHGTPANWLDLYGDADMPETEMFHNDRNILISKFASSAAHTQGHPLTGAETGTWLKEHFTETLADLKYLADDMFLSGVNRIFYHGACYSPDDAAWPGWLFYASTEMNPRNSIWHDVPALNEYIARCQSILQAGQPDNDVLLYWPVADFWSDPAGRVLPMSVSKTEWFEAQPIGKTAHELWNKGYAFDYISDEQLSSVAVFTNKISMKFLNGMDYETLVVPKCKFMSALTLNLIMGFAQSGGTVVFLGGLPADVPGLNHLKDGRSWLKKMEVAGEDIAKGKTKCRGRILIGELGETLNAAGISREILADNGLSFVRRSFDGGWNYFVANRSETNFDGWIPLARSAKSAAVLNPMTGTTGVAASRQSAANSTEFHVQLATGQSVILRAFSDQKVEGQAWSYWHTNGQPVEIAGQWKVKFLSGGPTWPADFQTAKLASWTTFPDANAQAFAGTAKYEVTFDAPPEWHGQLAREAQKNAAETETHGQDARATTCSLDLGDVRQSARVRLNGKDYGTLITPPFRVVVDNLKPSGNVLEVEVTSVAANRIRDLDRRGVNWKIFKDINIVNVDYQPFDAANWPLTDCGLLGPVTLTAVAAK